MRSFNAFHDTDTVSNALLRVSGSTTLHRSSRIRRLKPDATAIGVHLPYCLFGV